MRFEEVFPALRKGKKIRRAFWWKGHYFELKSDGIANQDGKNFTFGKDDLMGDDWEIIEEKRKVKLRDLTYEQFKKWVENYCAYSNCRDCLFDKVNCFITADNCWVNHKNSFSDKFLDQEVEIEE